MIPHTHQDMTLHAKQNELTFLFVEADNGAKNLLYCIVCFARMKMAKIASTKIKLMCFVIYLMYFSVLELTVSKYLYNNIKM